MLRLAYVHCNRVALVYYVHVSNSLKNKLSAIDINDVSVKILSCN